MKITKRELKNGDIAALYNYCARNIANEGLSAKFSLMMCKNIQALQQAFINYQSKVYIKELDPEWAKYTKAHNDITEKYGDRDENGNLIKDNDVVRVTEQIVEFNTANETLDNTFKEVLQRVNLSSQYNNDLSQQTQEVEYVTLDLDEIPDKTPPYIVGIVLNEE